MRPIFQDTRLAYQTVESTQTEQQFGEYKSKPVQAFEKKFQESNWNKILASTNYLRYDLITPGLKDTHQYQKYKDSFTEESFKNDFPSHSNLKVPTLLPI